MVPKLQASALVATFGGDKLFGPIDVSLGIGEWVGLVGPSGAGKTTLLRMLAGLIPAGGGRVRLDGRGPDELGWPRYRRRVVYVAQTPEFVTTTVEEALALPFSYGSSTASFDRASAVRALEELGLQATIMGRPVDRLSVGERQRVSLVRALLLKPSVLLLDEPTSALDSASTDRVHRRLRALTEEREASVLLVSHDRGLAREACTRSLELGR